MKELKLTNLEEDVLVALISELYAEPGFSDVDCKLLAELTDMSVNKVKGIIGSLCKKGICFVGEDDFENIVYLHSDYWYLHPNWKYNEENNNSIGPVN